ncbi:MAG: DUF177 domain-containing protein [Kineosporiaceae bacterium]
MAATTRHSRVDPRSPYAVDIHHLGRRPGAQQRVARDVPAPADLGGDVIGVPAGTPVAVAVSLESVLDGVYVTGTASARADGECVRCLDRLERVVSADLQELYLYAAPAPGGDDPDELPLVDGYWIDLEGLLRDSLVTALPFQPVCSPDCPGLCSRCGDRLTDDPDHAHQDVDPRWEALRGLAVAGGAAGTEPADRPTGEPPA